jgi:photosystem II stability/assembly factor-like uncharacterized protein
LRQLAVVACVAVAACKPSVAPVLVVTPADGSTLSSKCPVRIEFSKSVDPDGLTIRGDMATNVSILPRSVDSKNDTIELYPSAGEWKTGSHTLSVELSLLDGSGKVSLRYNVSSQQDEAWKRSPSHASATFLQGTVRDITFVDANLGFIAGTGVWKTTDGGASWKEVSPSGPRWFVAVAALDASTVWAVDFDRQLFGSKDGGLTWTTLAALPRDPLIAIELLAIDSNNLLASMNSGLYRSSDGGVQFTRVTLPGSGTVTGLHLESPTSLWAVGSALFHSTDRGATWSASDAGVGGLQRVSADEAKTLWAVSADGTIAASTDGGPFVAQYRVDGGTQLLGVAAAGTGRVWAIDGVGRVFSADGDGGFLEGAVPLGAKAIARASASSVWISGDEGLVATSNGADWAVRVPGTDRILSSVWVSDPQTVTVVGEQGLVLTTSNGGGNWAGRDAGTAKPLTDVWGAGSERWAVSEDGNILYSANAGASWATRSTLGAPLRAIFGSDAQHLWTVGDNCLFDGASVWRSTDGARTWSEVPLTSVACLYDVWAADATHVWAVGIRGGSLITVPETVVLKSEDSGATWTDTSVGNGELTSIYGADAQHLWLAGRAAALNETQGLVARTSNGGTSWSREFWGPGNLYTDVFVTSGDDAWGVGPTTRTGFFSTPSSCGVVGRQPPWGPESLAAVHGTADGRSLWMVGDHGAIGTLSR